MGREFSYSKIFKNRKALDWNFHCSTKGKRSHYTGTFVLVCSSCHNKIPQTVGLTQQKFSSVLEAGHLRLRYWQVCFLPRPVSWVWRLLPLCCVCSPLISICVFIFSLLLRILVVLGEGHPNKPILTSSPL